MGCAPMEYYRKIKIREAKKLINSGVSVTRVSDMLGYSSVHNFSRAFKKYTGTADCFAVPVLAPSGSMC